MAIQITPDIETSLLIHSDEVNGSTSFKDSSTYGHTITAGGNIHHDNDTTIGGGPGKFGRTSIFSDGSGDYLSVPDHSAFDFGYGDFTIDFWLRLNSAGGNKNYISRRGASNDTFWFFRTEGGPEYQFDWYKIGGGASYSLLGGTPETNVWHHLAIVRRGRLVKMYEDGIVIDTHTESAPRSYDGGEEIYIAARYASGAIQWLDGWIDEVRITKGIARWTDSFVPPNKPYSVIGGDAVTDISGIDDDGLGNTSFGDIVIRSDPSEAAGDHIFTVNKGDGQQVFGIRPDGQAYQYSNTGGNLRLTQQADGEATINLIADNGNSGTGDGFIRYSFGDGVNWCVGVDNSDSNTFKIAQGGDPHVNTRMYILTNGNFDHNGSDLSDRTLKDNIIDIGDSLSLINQLKPKTFVMKSNPTLNRAGFIAQDVEEIIPSLVNGEEGVMGLDYKGVSAHLTKAVQELSAEVNKLQAQISGSSDFDALKTAVSGSS